MSGQEDFLRFASPNEVRTISRESLGFYHAVIIGAIYEFEEDSSHTSISFYSRPLKRVVEGEPFLCVTVGDPDSEKPYYKRATAINIEDHIEILAEASKNSDALKDIGEVLANDLDRPFPANIPPWRLLILPLSGTQCFIAFSFSHGIGDGPTGLSFHQKFIALLREAQGAEAYSPILNVSQLDFPPPFDTKSRLPISWSYLLSPFIAQFLPKFLQDLLGLRASVATVDKGTWLGEKIPTTTSGTGGTKLQIYEFESPIVEAVLLKARSHEAKFTGLFQHLIVRALSTAFDRPDVTNFCSQTAINMRPAIGSSPFEMGMYVSGAYESHPRAQPPPKLTEENWTSIRTSTQKLSKAASTLQDQAIGLLRYVPSVRKWQLGKLGQARDCSFEVSNIGAFNADPSGKGHKGKHPRIVKMVFSQPGHVISSPIEFNFVSVKGGNLVLTVTWYAGALGIPEDEENAFIERLCESFKKDFEGIATE